MITAAIGPELANIIQHGARMLGDVEFAVQACRTDPNPSSELAKICGNPVSGYLELRRQLAALPHSELTRRVDQLLNHELEMTGQASMLAFRPHDSHWEALAAGFGDGLGAPADELRRLAQAAADESATALTGGRWGVPDRGDLLQGDHSVVDQPNQLRQKRLDPLRHVDNDDDKGQLVADAHRMTGMNDG
jgi:hypothetical protein